MTQLITDAFVLTGNEIIDASSTDNLNVKLQQNRQLDYNQLDYVVGGAKKSIRIR